MTINSVDLVILVLLFGSIVMGYQRGFIRQAVQLAGFFVSFIVASMYFKDFSPVLQNMIPFPHLSDNTYFQFFAEEVDLAGLFYKAIAFGILFLGVKFGLTIVGHFLHQVVSLPGISTVNRGFGSILAFLEVSLILVIVINILILVPSQSIHNWTEHSFFVGLIHQHTPYLTDSLRDIWQTEGTKIEQSFRG